MIIRPASDRDWVRIGELSDVLVQTHHTFDPARFISLVELPGAEYVSRVRAHLTRHPGIVLVADAADRIVGFVFVAVEPENWKELRHEAGYIHDLAVDPEYRGGGAGTALVEAAVQWFAVHDVRRVMLWTATANITAQRIFGRAGFRPTMIEMTLERDQV